MKPLTEAIAEPLVRWYQENKRLFPWREDREPYHVWVSEIMLQQTRIEAAIGYYGRFMSALPTLQSLSEIPEEQLLKLWEGLGYYSRARNLKKAAEILLSEYNGVFPQSFDALLKLPGIGKYTAGAIASICFNERVPAVDGNVLRVVSRLTGSRKNVMLEETKKETEALLSRIMPPEAGDFNEGLMELGETLCLPNGTPLCGECPLKEFCTAKQQGLTAELPVRIKEQKRKKEMLTVAVIRTPDGEIALEKRSDKGLLSGLYQLPNLAGPFSHQTPEVLAKAWGLSEITPQFIGKAKHIFTHIEWHMDCCLIETEEKNSQFIWASPQALATQYPLPTAFQKVLRMIKRKL